MNSAATIKNQAYTFLSPANHSSAPCPASVADNGSSGANLECRAIPHVTYLAGCFEHKRTYDPEFLKQLRCLLLIELPE